MALGIGLAVGAVRLLDDVDSPQVGDVAEAEGALRGTPGAQTGRLDEPATAETPPTTMTTLPTPLWQPNLERDGARIPQPVGLRIDAIGVAADVVPRGVDPETGQMDVPDNVSDVAWYQYGAAPGQPGSAVLAAHVDLSGQGPGVFFHLDDLEPGDVIHVALDDGADLAYTVVARTTYPKKSLPLDVIFSEEGPAMLTLVTCGGDFDTSTSRYDSNVVVYSRLLPEVQRTPGPERMELSATLEPSSKGDWDR